MSLSIKDVEHIAELARLELSHEEKERFRLQLSSILDFFRKLQSVDTSQINISDIKTSPGSFLRPDQTHISLSTQETLGNAAETEKDQFKVPPIFGDKDA